MKAVNMTFRSEALKAIKNPVRDITKLTGGIGRKLLDERQIQRLKAAQLAEQKARKERLEWQRFAKKCSTTAVNKVVASKASR
jgi:hypothetical protein